MTVMEDLKPLLTERGPWTYAYVDGHGKEPQVVEESRDEAVLERLREAGAPEADVEGVAEALRGGTGVPSPSARFLLVRQGRVEFDESFVGARYGSEQLGSAPVPKIVPLIRHRTASVRYLVVEAGRDGANIRLERTGRALAEETRRIEGDDDALPKVQAGGWSHSRWQRHSEEVWKHNQSEVAGAVDRLVRQYRPAFIALAGDVRARQLLREQLPPESADLVVEVDANTRAAGADSELLDETVSRLIDEHLEAEAAEALEAAAVGGGERRVEGLPQLVLALQEARLERLLLDARSLDGDERLEELDAPPWIAVVGEPQAGAARLASAPFVEALARAAILTGARVHILEETFASADAPREDRAPRPPVGVLR